MGGILVKAIIIDDEIIAIDLLSILLNNYKNIEIVGKYTNPIKALEDIKETKPDIIFLDIEMEEINGIEIANQLLDEGNNIDIVFITAYSKYAVEAFRVNAIDYLLKPIDKKQLEEAITRIDNKKKESFDILENKAYINSLGSFALFDENKNILSWRTQKAKELFVYLWDNQNQAVSKTIILEMLFPGKDIKNGTIILHTTVYQVRKLLEKLGYSKTIAYKNESYQLVTQINSDIEKLDEILAIKEYGEKHIEKILEIYKGGFLEKEGYNWALEKQYKYRDLVINILEEYVNKQFEKNNYNLLAKQCLDKLHSLDSNNENIVKKLIEYYGELGKRGELKHFFVNFKKNFWKELSLEPQKSTLELYEKYMS